VPHFRRELGPVGEHGGSISSLRVQMRLERDLPVKYALCATGSGYWFFLCTVGVCLRQSSELQPGDEDLVTDRMIFVH